MVVGGSCQGGAVVGMGGWGFGNCPEKVVLVCEAEKEKAGVGAAA